jgi:hypothetical protein
MAARKAIKGLMPVALGVAAAMAITVVAPSPAFAQFNPCVRPQRPLLPIQGSVMSQTERNSILLQYSRYFDDLSRYMRCLSNELEDAQLESEESIEIYNQFNQGSQY